MFTKGTFHWKSGEVERVFDHPKPAAVYHVAAQSNVTVSAKDRRATAPSTFWERLT